MSGLRDFLSQDVGVLSVNFIDGGVVEIVYVETRDQTKHAGLMKTIALDAEEFKVSAQELHDEIVDLLFEGLEHIRHNRAE